MRIIGLIVLWALGASACDLGDRVMVRIGTNDVAIDRCIAPIVRALNVGGVPTISSCCGHGETNGYILLYDRLIVITAKTNYNGAIAEYGASFAVMSEANWKRRMNLKRSAPESEANSPKYLP